MRIPTVRDGVDEETETIRAAGTAHLGRPARRVPGVFGSRPGHTGEAGWSQVWRVMAAATTIYATILGSPSRASAQRRPGVAPDLRVRPVPPGERDRSRAGLRVGRAAVRPAAARARAPLAAARRGSGRRARSSSASSRRRGRLAARQGGARYSAGSRSGAGGKLLGTPRSRRDSRRPARPASRAGYGWYAGRTVHHIRRFFASL